VFDFKKCLIFLFDFKKWHPTFLEKHMKTLFGGLTKKTSS